MQQLYICFNRGTKIVSQKKIINKKVTTIYMERNNIMQGSTYYPLQIKNFVYTKHVKKCAKFTFLFLKKVINKPLSAYNVMYVNKICRSLHLRIFFFEYNFYSQSFHAGFVVI